MSRGSLPHPGLYAAVRSADSLIRLPHRILSTLLGDEVECASPLHELQTLKRLLVGCRMRCACDYVNESYRSSEML
jgi:hypothetical protein